MTKKEIYEAGIREGKRRIWARLNKEHDYDELSYKRLIDRSDDITDLDFQQHTIGEECIFNINRFN